MTAPNPEDTWTIGSFIVLLSVFIWFVVASSLAGYDKDQSAQLQYKIRKRQREEEKNNGKPS